MKVVVALLSVLFGVALAGEPKTLSLEQLLVQQLMVHVSNII